ncbi:amino acid kinase family protein [Methanohalophilus mahii]|uniref:Aspartate/glutamate/uridylate kinase n=1 Tax=Methanohalophilus mahii (strain ATCC 35705 / DSM 5219 / SLP) TaxID=547558 RepID=D5E7H9_METMS|nr:aspartate/glutamate/uridylate kinase [Methanohalophilus mahii]ADE37117.1 aspartate/glutamate/uridylate kinase [Methanohalophilus mahii DSM 5219]
MKEKVVLKLGGSLIKQGPELLLSLKNWVKDRKIQLLVVPGGGPFANQIRDMEETTGFDDDTAHWLAILSMEQYGIYLREKTKIETTATLSSFEGVRILLPYRFLTDNDDLPHSWGVTSDTIGAKFAQMSGANYIKVTDVDGILQEGNLLREITASDIIKMGQSCVDTCLPNYLIKHEMNCTIVNGNYFSRITETIMGNRDTGTYIRGKF